VNGLLNVSRISGNKAPNRTPNRCCPYKTLENVYDKFKDRFEIWLCIRCLF
jgi:hypothetical protein